MADVDPFALVARRAAASIRRLSDEGVLPPAIDPGRFTVAPPGDGSPCDMVVDAVPVYARDAASVGTDPRAVVRALSADLRALPEVEAVEVVGPGLLTVTLHAARRFAAVAALLRAGMAAPSAPRPAVDAGAPSLEHARATLLGEMRAALAAAAGRPCGSGSREAGGFTACAAVVVTRRDDVAVPVAVSDVLAAIGPDAFRFAVAARRADAVLHLDFDALADRCRSNPPFWVAYAHARFKGVLRRASAAMPGVDLAPRALAAADLSALSDAGEAALARLIVRHPHVLGSAAAAGAPSRLVAHLRDLADAVHSQWNRSKDQPQLRFVNEERRELSQARLGLVAASTLVLSSGLGILGITAPDEMR